MRKLILIVVLVVPVFGLALYAEQSYEGYGEAFGYGSEEAGTGAYLGVDINDITPDRLAELKLKEEHGVEVTMVDQDAPAGKAGLKEHDVILSLNGAAVESGAQLRRLIRETPPGRIVTLNLSRDGQPMTVKVQLSDRQKTMSWAPKAKEYKFTVPPVPPMPEIDVPVSVVVVHSSMRSGLMVENITQQLGEFFGVKNGTGVLIRSVEKGSRADKAGFRAGDIVVRVNDQAVRDTSDFTHALRSRDGNTVTLGIVRDKREQTITLTLPDRKESGGLIEEETIEIPDVDVDVQAELADVQAEIARIQPQIELAINESRRAVEQSGADPCEVEQEVEDQQQDLEQQQKELEEQKQELEDQIREQQQDLIHQQEELQQEIHIQGFEGQLPI